MTNTVKYPFQAKVNDPNAADQTINADIIDCIETGDSIRLSVAFAEQAKPAELTLKMSKAHFEECIQCWPSHMTPEISTQTISNMENIAKNWSNGKPVAYCPVRPD